MPIIWCILEEEGVCEGWLLYISCASINSMIAKYFWISLYMLFRSLSL